MAANGIRYLDVIVDVGDRRLPDAEILVRILRTEWENDDVIFKEFSTGYNNKLVACMRSGDARDMSDVIVVRVYGPNTELMIDRDREIRCQRLFHAAGCAPALLCRFKNGFVYRYAHGRMFDLELAYEPEVMRSLTKELAKVHSVKSENIQANDEEEEEEEEEEGEGRGGGGEGGGGGGGDGLLETRPQLFKSIDKFLQIVSQDFEEHEKLSKFSKMAVGDGDLEKEVEYLRSVLPSLRSPVVLCHNDLLFNNILHDQRTNKITFIDFEFSSWNYQAFDIATHFCEYAGMDTVDYSKYPDRSHQYAWLRCYLEEYSELLRGDEGSKEDISEEAVERLRLQVNWFTLGSHMFWALWALVQSKYSVIDYDYLEYSSIRLKEYFRKKKTLLEEPRVLAK